MDKSMSDDKPAPRSVADVMRIRTVTSAWGRYNEQRLKAAALWQAAIASVAGDRKIDKAGEYRARDLCQMALAHRDQQAADVEWWSTVLHHYGDDVRVLVTVEQESGLYVVTIGDDRFTAEASRPRE
jgi:hypothetical protein